MFLTRSLPLLFNAGPTCRSFSTRRLSGALVLLILLQALQLPKCESSMIKPVMILVLTVCAGTLDPAPGYGNLRGLAHLDNDLVTIQ